MKAKLLQDICQIDLKEEVESVNEEEKRQCSMLQKEFSKKVLQEEIKWKQRSRNK